MSHSIKINYYDTFRCIADQCPFTCCQEWRIGVDEKTLQKWKGLKLKTTDRDEKNQSELTLCDCVEKEETGQIIKLGKDKKCPFLNEKKLCKIVLELGENHLSDTCTTFPRQINTFEDRTEYSLDPGCPAVVDLLNQNLNAIQEESSAQSASLLYLVREMIFTILEDETYLLTERMMMIFYALLELLEEKHLSEEKINAYKNRKQLQPLVDAIRKMNFNSFDSFFERNELFLDVVENYRKQKLYVAYLEDISLLAEELEEAYVEEEILEKLEAFEEELIAYEKLLKNYLIAEIFGNCLMPDMTLEDMVISFQWITLEYSVIKQAIFLKWLAEGEKTVTYEMVKCYITVISRVTGYDQSDIKEYLENSFESIIWEWGYLALIVGNRKL
ncbi:MAG: flagellin lysine-N-methylase [Candidatus Cellulosilyticum pullistercoris]|uniref:Flagellin lysine-N-methylase n=1 Tax=Candidatus Cellulosilyticum pullistercoris TaxID=2838521 RepID=A0A9E2KAX8_9FIRM|nr:flagellin lysine-N-methylase [Candidatus Cellulosilyticum pullistercoris]